MFKRIFSFFFIFSLLFSHFSTEPCFQLEDCPKCEECKECKECKPCPELEEWSSEPCPECPEICEGTCYSDEEVINIEAFIQQLEVDKDYCIKTRDNMQIELNQWYVQDSTYQALIKDMEQTIELRDKLIKAVTPKWWENKWIMIALGFFIGSKFSGW